MKDKQIVLRSRRSLNIYQFSPLPKLTLIEMQKQQMTLQAIFKIKQQLHRKQAFFPQKMKMWHIFTENKGKIKTMAAVINAHFALADFLSTSSMKIQLAAEYIFLVLNMSVSELVDKQERQPSGTTSSPSQSSKSSSE